MIAVILSWAVLFMVFLSFGEIAVCFWNNITKRKDSYSITDKFWIGICLIGTILLYISLFAALNIGVLGALSAVSLTYWIWNRKALNKYFIQWKEIIKNYSLLEKAIFAFILIAVLIYSVSTPLIYDEGLYHLQTMQWNEKFGAIFGLGNIHGRLGFNSSFLLLSTVFNYHPSVFLTAFTINSLCLFIFAIWLLTKIVDSKSIIKIAALSLVLLISMFSLGANISSTSTDILPNIFILYLLLSWTLNKDTIQKKPLLLAFVSIFCITLKLSSVVVLLAAVACMTALYRSKDKKAAIVILALGIIVAIPWLIRFVILTGYLVYPFPAIDIFSVDWKIPIDLVAHEKDIAYAWARIPTEDASKVLNMNFGEWFPIWIKNLSFYNLFLYMLVLISPIVMYIGQRTIKNINQLSAWAIAFVGVIFGLLTAPDFRFGLGFIVCAGVIPFINLSNISEIPILKTTIQVGLTLSIVGIMYIAYSQVSTYQYLSNNSSWTLMYKPQDINLLQKKANISFEEYKLNNTIIFVPRETNQCFDQSIPCAPYYNSNLEMRGNKIQDGFRIKNK